MQSNRNYYENILKNRNTKDTDNIRIHVLLVMDKKPIYYFMTFKLSVLTNELLD